MNKQEMVALLRSACVDENAVTLAINAWEMGAEYERERIEKTANIFGLAVVKPTEQDIK
jgi:hypothetical protein